MNSKEHELMIHLLAAQFKFSMTLFEILKSRDLAKDSDLAAFYELVRSGDVGAQDHQFREMYSELARSLGVQIHQPGDHPPSS